MNKKKNRLEIRLDPDSHALLDSLIVRTSLTKTSIIKNALKVYASALKNGHIYTVKLKGSTIKAETTAINDVQNDDITEEEEKNYQQLMEESKKLDENHGYDLTKDI